MLGLRNVFGDVDKRLIEPSIEEIVDRDPDVIILLLQGTQTPQSVREALRTRPELQNVTAVENDDIIVLPSGFILPSPTAVEGLEPSPESSTRSDEDAMSSRAITSVATT